MNTAEVVFCSPPLCPHPSFQQWYSNSMKVICVWLADRLDLQLHIYQLKTLIKIVKVNKVCLDVNCPPHYKESWPDIVIPKKKKLDLAE
jgi:hypothetical protein